MTIGLVVDGDSEYHSFRSICEKISGDCGTAFLRPTKAPVDPMAPAAAIARMVKDRVIAAEARGATLVIVLLDRETRVECPGELAEAIKKEIDSYSSVETSVVLKDSKYENWLVADIEALARMRARFEITTARRRQVAPNHADRIDAHELLKRAAVKDAYDKVADSVRITAAADPAAMARNSRSFRRFLHCAGYAAYQDQSRNPA